ncbi:MAG: DNA topoisomerase (ATP-hydrolyzing) subunit B [Parcubacteria group bacterium]|nr:DNA topoisomerase (ATP-hydrolyzing) subunit B [Parcubacteria group bacterium]
MQKKAAPASRKQKSQPENNYTAKDIYVLEGLEPVRKRPGMYIGSTGVDGLHHLIWEVADNSLDEAMAGYATEIEMVLLPDNRVRVSDNGRGIPVEKHKQTKKSALETVMTTLHAGGKFGGESYKVSGGLHGVGVSVVNALSDWLRIEVRRDGALWEQEYVRGKPKAKIKKAGKATGSGTTVIFQPDKDIFKTIAFDWERILEHFRQQAYLTRGVRITARDERESELRAHRSHAFYFDGGVRSYVRHLNRGFLVKQQTIFFVEKQAEQMLVEIALQYSEDLQSRELSFANNIYTPEGGMHLTGFRTALTRTLNDFARANGYLKKDEDNLTGEDVREGLTAVISLKLPEPQFEGQTKAKLGNPEARSVVEGVFSEALTAFLEEHPQDGRAIAEKVILALKARKAAKAAKDTVLRKGALEGLALPGKLADCQSCHPEESEIFVVEGDSAGGCFSGDTRIALTDGRNVSFRQLAEENEKGKKNYCYTIQHDGRVGIGLIKHPRQTKTHADVINITLDNGETITCTPDHLFMLRNGSYKMAKDLTERDSLMPLHRKLSKIGGAITIDGYELVFDTARHQWIFTHLLADAYNLAKGFYKETNGGYRHHIDFNKLNNSPENITRLTKEQHLRHHSLHAQKTLNHPEVRAKLKALRATPQFREKIRRAMTRPAMRQLLSIRARKQWENDSYKIYMTNKFLEFYRNNPDYQRRNREMLAEAQRIYWNKPTHRARQAERVKEFFIQNPEIRKIYSQKAKIQWNNAGLLAWRSQKTKEQWTPEFRIKRKRAYDKTYYEKALQTLHDIYQRKKEIDINEYNKIRIDTKNKNLIRYKTICNRFFSGDEKTFREAVINYNHRIKSVRRLKKKTDVFDLEVEGTHNFALASGVFVHNSAKMARDRRFQAILPLRGKILNVERARLDKTLSSKEIKALIIALGAAIGDDLNIEKLRYHKIVLMTDADVDGAHIRTLLLTFFYRYYRSVIEAGYLYIAQPPLYRIQKGKIAQYAYDETARNSMLKEMSAGKEEIRQSDEPSDAEEASEEEAATTRTRKVIIQRYKGLGEMNPEQLWETTMNPEHRILLRVTIEDAEKADRVFDTLMGSEVAPRKLFIQTHAKTVQNLDV